MVSQVIYFVKKKEDGERYVYLKSCKSGVSEESRKNDSRIVVIS